METPIQVEPKKSNTGLIIGIVVVVLLCCCCLIVIGLLTLMGPMVGKVFSSINNSLLTPVPVLPGGVVPATPDLSGIPTISSDQIPQGGKSDQFSRILAWSKVLIAASTNGCGYNLKPSDTQIKVTQEADSKGVWKEQWTVVCDDGTKKPYDITFTPDASGVTDIVVTAGQ